MAIMKRPNATTEKLSRNGSSQNPDHNAGNHRRLPPTAPRTGCRPLIAVFGSAQARRGDRLYAAGLRMGELLGRSGFDVMNGGYQGVMEAVSRGASMAGAHVIGVTMRRFADRVNPHVMDEIRTANFYERFEWLVNRADGYVAMHGGIGTLAEVTFTWQEISLGMVQKRPLVLVGERWRRLFTCFRKDLIAPREIYAALTIAPTPEKAIAVLRSAFAIDSEAKVAPPRSLTARAAREGSKLHRAKPRSVGNETAKHYGAAKHSTA
jgi:uncharacterized protein (TIGR00730 family)